MGSFFLSAGLTGFFYGSCFFSFESYKINGASYYFGFGFGSTFGFSFWTAFLFYWGSLLVSYILGYFSLFLSGYDKINGASYAFSYFLGYF